ncbi:MAG: dipeptidase, partial [bacterium]
VYIPGEIEAEGFAKVQLEQIDIARRVIERYPESLALALTAADIEAIFKTGRIASLLGMEGGHAIENSLGALRAFYALGARYMTLTHNVTLDWADTAAEAPKHNGLTAFGKEVVREMNLLGMLIDLSHVSPKVMSDALSISEAPVIFSHSSARALINHVRNVPDSILTRLPQNGGVVMVTFVPVFVSQEVINWDTPIRERLTKAVSDDERDRIRKEYEATHPMPKATISQVADHIEHVRKVAGIDHVGIGSDFDGTSALPIGLEDTSKFPNLFAELIRRGWSDADLKKLAGENLLRALQEAEATAQRLQKTRPPSAATIEALDGPQTNLQYDAMAAKIAGALKLHEGERVLIRFDPGYFNELVEPLRSHIRTAGAVEVGALEYIESATIRNGVRSDDAQPRVFEQLLETVDVYLWLPVRTGLREIPAPESQALQRWLDKGGARRQIHFHWSQGSVLADGLAGEHSAALDSVYQSALDIDYAALSTTQDRATNLLRSGTVRVRTPAGTDLNFRIGERPFNKQNGDASTERAQKADVRIDREIELPAG